MKLQKLNRKETLQAVTVFTLVFAFVITLKLLGADLS